MPNRYIRASAIESEAVNALSWQGEVFYRRLLNRCDDFGRYTGNHALIRAAVFPLQLDRVREADIPKLLTECEKCGLLFRYSVDSKPFIALNKWENGRAKNSEFPPPPSDVCERMQTYVYTSKQTCGHAPDPDSDPDSDPESDHYFAQFWSLYPRKTGRKDAERAFKSATKKQPDLRERILASCSAYAEAVAKWPAGNEQFVPHPATWLNRGSYDDDPSTWKRNANTSSSTPGSSRHFENADPASRTAF